MNKNYQMFLFGIPKSFLHSLVVYRGNLNPRAASGYVKNMIYFMDALGWYLIRMHSGHCILIISGRTREIPANYVRYILAQVNRRFANDDRW